MTIPSNNLIKKSLYEVGEIPPLGHVPDYMHAWVIRRERHGPPIESFKPEIVETHTIGRNEVLIMVMAAGVNYNGVWAGLGKPISPFEIHKADFHIPGSDASGIIWAVGDDVKGWEIGDHIIVHCNQDDGDDVECNGGDPMFSASQRIWGYETPDGSFSQFSRVQTRQLLKKPKHLSWEESACYALTLSTAYRMLFGYYPNDLRPGQNVLVWGASGGLGSFAIQLINAVGANAIAVISDDKKGPYVMDLGAAGFINRSGFKCWGQMPAIGTKAHKDWSNETKRFGKEIWAFTGKGNNVDLVFEHPGQDTIGVSSFVCKKGGMVVLCAATTGYNLTIDARYLWMHQKRIQGSHFANMKQATQANKLMIDGKIKPCMSEVFKWKDLPLAHSKMHRNEHKPGNMSVLIQSQKCGLGL